MPASDESLPLLIDALSKPSAYPFPVDKVEVRQTHISVVFLVGDFVYKLKKPVKLPFLDFSTLERRRFFCNEELRLNRRLAPDVYVDVVPVSRHSGGLTFEGTGAPVEWALKMRRLPDSASLERRVERDDIDAAALDVLARRLAGFHAAADTSERISGFGRFEMVARNIRANFEISAPLVGVTISHPVRERLVRLTEAALERSRPLMETRASRGVPRDTHGDLHVDHVYLFPDRDPPADLVIVDCIEFNEQFRYTDPIADMAFLAMDLQFHGRYDLADGFIEAYFDATGDNEGRQLLPMYLSYRAAVRGKVDGLQLNESEIPEADRAEALQRGRGHWLLALHELEEPRLRPGLVLVGGLPGTGKSTLARALADAAGFQVLRSDVVRKELAGVPVDEPAAANGRQGIYTPEWNDRTYVECLQRAERRLFEGERVLIDATFQEERYRQQFLDAAIRWGVPLLFLVCEAQPETVRARLATRRGDASDADWTIYQLASERWEKPGPQMERHTCTVRAEASAEAVREALQALTDAGLWPRS